PTHPTTPSLHDALPISGHPSISTIALDPAAGGTIYAGTNRGLLKTTDGGMTWSLLLPFTAIRDLAVDPGSTARSLIAVNGRRSEDRKSTRLNSSHEWIS